MVFFSFFFFFQAEDGIRDTSVTGVQTCALPILAPAKQAFRDIEEDLLFVLDERGHSVHLTDRGVDFMSPSDHDAYVLPDLSEAVHRIDHAHDLTRSEERRVGKECRDRWGRVDGG